MKVSRVFDELIKVTGQSFEQLADYRTGGNTRYEIKDAAVSAFGVFFTQSQSVLAYQSMIEKAKGKSNVQSLFGCG